MSDAPAEDVSATASRLHNLRLGREEAEEARNLESEGEFLAADSPQNMQPPGNILMSRVRRALAFAVSEEPSTSSANRIGEISSSNIEE